MKVTANVRWLKFDFCHRILWQKDENNVDSSLRRRIQCSIPKYRYDELWCFQTIKSKSEISNVRLGLESLSACLEIRSRFLATGHDPDVETEVFDPDLYSFVAQKAVSKAFKHFNENSPIADFDLFKNSIRNGTDKASLQRWAQQEVLNVFSSDLTTSHVPMSVDLFPTLRFIAKSEDER